MCRKGNNLWRTSLDRLGRVGLSVIFGNEIRGEWRGPRSGKAGGVPVEIASVPRGTLLQKGKGVELLEALNGRTYG